MSSTIQPLQAHSGIPVQKLEKEIQSGTTLHHVAAPDSNLSQLKRTVINEAASHGTNGLHHVEAPKDGLLDSVKQAYLEDHQQGAQGRDSKKSDKPIDSKARQDKL